MLKRFRISALVLAAATVMTVLPAVSQARDRDDHRGRQVTRHEMVRPRPQEIVRARPIRPGYGFVPAYNAPRGGYWDSHGVWCAYGR